MPNLLFCTHSLCINYVTKTFLLVSSSVRSINKQLLFSVHGQGKKNEQKRTTKNFVGFENHSPLLTLFRLRDSSIVIFTFPIKWVDFKQ